MEVVHTRCAALDVSKADVKVAVRTPSKRRGQRRTEVRTFVTATGALLEMREWLQAEGSRSLIAGERDSKRLAEFAKGRLRVKIQALEAAMIGRFTDHHAFLCRLHLDRIDAIDRDIAALSARSRRRSPPFASTLRNCPPSPASTAESPK